MSQELDIPLSDIFVDNDWNCRGMIEKTSVIGLAEDINKNGLLQRVIIVPLNGNTGYKYKLIAGHCRYLACSMNKWEKIPCKIMEGLSALQQRSINVRENIQRKELNILQEARGLRDYRQAGWNIEMIANEFQESRNWVHLRLCLLDLPEDIQQLAGSGILNQKQIMQVWHLPINERYKAVRMVKDQKLRGDKVDPIEKEFGVRKYRKDPFKRKRREPNDILDMNSWIYDTLGPCLATRVLAWAAAEVSDAEIYREVRAAAKELGVPFSFPDGVHLND